MHQSQRRCDVVMVSGKGEEVKGTSLGSKPGCLVCPLCEAGKLQPFSNGSTRCGSCGGILGRAMVVTLEQIAALPDALGAHACECGHPEMRWLPGGIYHCSACGLEVLPFGTPALSWGPEDVSEAYREGWTDGRFREIGSFADNPSLSRWEDPLDRLDYYRGHRAGCQTRLAASGGRLPTVHDKSFG